MSRRVEFGEAFEALGACWLADRFTRAIGEDRASETVRDGARRVWGKTPPLHGRDRATKLASLALRLLRLGADVPLVVRLVHAFNLTYCLPPHDPRRVESIVEWAVAEEADRLERLAGVA